MIELSLNGTSALRALAADATLIPAYTCDTVQKAFEGFICGYVDIELATYGVSFSSLKEAVAKYKPKTVVLQHLHGMVARDYLRSVCFLRKANITIIEDCTQAWGTLYKSNPVGSLGDFAVYSFGRYKTIPLGIGGLLQTNPHKLRHVDFLNIIKNRRLAAYEWFSCLSQTKFKTPLVVHGSIPSFCWFPIRVENRESFTWPPKTRFGFEALADLPNALETSKEIVTLPTNINYKKIASYIKNL